MKRLLLMAALWSARPLTTHAQLAVLAGQLAALRTLQQTVQQGYHTVTTGLQIIGRITNGEYQLHEAYFGRLNNINPVIGDDPKLEALRSAQAKLLQALTAALDYWRQQRSLQP